MFLVDAQLPCQLSDFPKKPSSFLLVSTGNIRNTNLMNLFSKNIASILEFFTKNKFVELTNEDIIGHE